MILAASLAGLHSALSPAGPQAARIDTVWWVYFGVCAAVFVLVVGFMLVAAARPRPVSEPIDAPILLPNPQRERRMRQTVIGAVGLTIILLFVLLIVDFVSGRAIDSMSSSKDPVKIAVTGHQWWWEIAYSGETPSRLLSTANEIHIPVGRPVSITLSSTDVIHSFWVPNLQGKRDMIPGHSTTIWLQADHPGTYEGQCAEFCGAQHAQMRLMVVAQSPREYQTWYDAQLKSAAEPSTDQQRKGQQVFLSSSCILCHTIRGTTAGARLGPDLTHIASRTRIAANSLPNTPGHLAGWIVDPQKIKPGVIMPQNNLAPEDLRALLEYLEALK